MGSTPVVVTIYLKKDSDFREMDVSTFSLDNYVAEHMGVWRQDELHSQKESFLEATFESGNVGELRNHLSRSLSVGDLIVAEAVAYANFPIAIEEVGPKGWNHYTM